MIGECDVADILIGSEGVLRPGIISGSDHVGKLYYCLHSFRSLLLYFLVLGVFSNDEF